MTTSHRLMAHLLNLVTSCLNGSSSNNSNNNCQKENAESIVSQIEGLNELLTKTKVFELCDSPPQISANESKFHCETSPLHVMLLGYCYPAAVILCILGNIANIVTYSKKMLRKSTTVELLMIKAVMNILFMTCLLPKHIVWFLNSGPARYVNLEKTLWQSWPYFLYVANVAGSSSTWMTVLMTLERYLYVAWPTSSKSWCSHPNVKKATYTVVIVFLIIHSQTPISRVTEITICEGSRIRNYKLLMRPGYGYVLTEQLYSLLNLLLSLVIPGILLVAFTSRLIFILSCRSLPQFSARKRCVTRIALATMVCQLTLEVPAVGVYGAAALWGVEFVNDDPAMCTCHVLSNFANQLNASICFIIYVVCSETFRELFCSRFCTSSERTRSYSSSTIRYYSTKRVRCHRVSSTKERANSPKMDRSFRKISSFQTN